MKIEGKGEYKYTFRVEGSDQDYGLQIIFKNNTMDSLFWTNKKNKFEPIGERHQDDLKRFYNAMLAIRKDEGRLKE